LHNHIKTHWTGHTYFIWLIAINLIGVRFLTYGIATVFQTASTTIWMVLFPIITIILIWQIKGSIESAKRGLDHPDGIFKLIALFFITTAITISTIWQVTDQYHHLYDPSPPPFVDPSIITLTRSSDGAEITITGSINLKQYNAFRDIIDVEKLRLVVLDSQGGNIFAARGFHRLIVERGLDTHVTTNCFSACTIIFIAGQNRTAAATARFGFHAYAYRHNHTGQQINIATEQAKDIARFKRINTPNSFITQIFNTPSDEMWHPTHADLHTANILK
jgi:hypothetical protein